MIVLQKPRLRKYTVHCTTKGKQMANIITRKAPVREPKAPKEKKFKKFKMVLEFTEREDTLAFAEALAGYAEGAVTKLLVEKAYR